MKLVVLAGAKQGTEIPLKRDKFVIGRASDCTLRAGSESISRHHCAIVRSEQGLTVRDLGSRNGTYVNDAKIEAETLLANGDKVRVGTLEFRVDTGHDIDRSKKPKVKDVAEAVSRSAGTDHDSGIIEDDISRWLIGPAPGSSVSSRETQSFKMDETRTMAEISPVIAQALNVQPQATEAEAEPEAEAAEEKSSEGDKGKKSYGKLPPIPKKLSKDSREAATDILREMTRRR